MFRDDEDMKRVILPGSPVGPSAMSGVDREGIQVSVDTFNMGVHVGATDLSINSRGCHRLAFSRYLSGGWWLVAGGGNSKFKSVERE